MDIRSHQREDIEPSEHLARGAPSSRSLVSAPRSSQAHQPFGSTPMSTIDSCCGASSFSFSSFSSCTTTTRCADGRAATYSSRTTSIRRPGDAAPVTEQRSAYRDSSGVEKVGLGRSIGQRGRSIVAERAANGTEQRIDTLFHVETGTEFDDEWEANDTAADLERLMAQGHGGLHGGMSLGLPFGGGMSLGLPFGGLLDGFGGGSLASSMLPTPGAGLDATLDSSTRRTVQRGRREYEMQRDRMIADARRQRP